jgi:hypothetical protein
VTASRPDVFLSYSREDQATARRFAEALQREGFNVWWDQALSTGEAYDAVTEAALDAARAVVVLWSGHSVKSRWVRAEATTADRNGVLMPVMIEPCRRPVMFELMQTAELGHWRGETNDPAWRAFVADLKRLVLRGQSPEAAVLLERAGQGQVESGVSVTAASAPSAPPSVPLKGRGKPLIAAAGVAIVALVAFATWPRFQGEKGSPATIAEVAALTEAGEMQAAFDLARRLRARDRPALQTLAPLFAKRYSITSEPEGAEVSYRPYDKPEAPWQRLGLTPLAEVELPRQAARWRLTKPGYETVELATAADNTVSPMGVPAPGWNEIRQVQAVLAKPAELPAGMLAIPAGRSGLLPRVGSAQVPAYFIDRHEVTNAQYKDFVDAGGYERRAFWEGMEFRKDGKLLSFEQAMQLFRDTTGRAGPATWELGSYPQGRAAYPVTGVSWYEAAAYARFRGASLPTVFHWARAAIPDTEQLNSLAVSITPLSNFGSDGPVPVGSRQGVGPFGTYDMLGNAREWVLNAGAGQGLLIGGSWADAMYNYNSPTPAALIDRSEVNGLRLMRDGATAYAAGLAAPRDASLWTARSDAKPVSEEAFATLRQQLEYRAGPLNASAPETLATTEEWIKQRVTIDVGYSGQRMDVIVFVPRHAPGPFQPVIFFSGAGQFMFPSTLETVNPGFEGMPLEFIVRSGRMLVYPVYEGSVTRFREPISAVDAMGLNRLVTAWRTDLGRTIDYLQTRPDVDSQRLGYLAVSLGASTALPAMAMEPRFKAAVLISGGVLAAPNTSPLTDPVNFAPRIRIPVLMFNGRYDPYFTVQDNQLPLFRLLGAPPADKRFVQAAFAHVSPPRAELLRETLAWYDKYLGPVTR